MALTQGSCIGPYVIGSPIGEGGMGVVYRARDTRLERDVALKLLPQHSVDDEAALNRFEREAKAGAALSHPNILTLVETLNLLLHDDLPPLAVTGRVFSAGIELIVTRCLEKDPADRFRSAHDLAVALTATLSQSGLTTQLIVDRSTSMLRRLLALAGPAWPSRLVCRRCAASSPLRGRTWSRSSDL